MFRRYAIENLTIYLVSISAVVSAVSTLGMFAVEAPHLELLLSAHFWHILLYPFALTYSGFLGGWLWLLLYLYMLWNFGSSLEAELGSTRYNIYIFSGIFITTVAQIGFSLIVPYELPPSFLYTSIFLAIAYLHPDSRILLFFFIPVKLKWLGLLLVGFLCFYALQLTLAVHWLFATLPLVTYGNFLFFFASDLLHRLGYRNRRLRKMQPARAFTVHRCVVCGLTENDDPLMDFRYCVECTDHEYCRQHLDGHTHIK